jgi:hypothetical protein
MFSNIWNVTDILPDVATNLELEGWMFYVFAALVFGIIIGGMMRGLAKLVLGIVMLSWFAVVILLLIQKQDVLSMIVSVVFGIVMLVSSFLVKLRKTYPFPKR